MPLEHLPTPLRRVYEYLALYYGLALLGIGGLLWSVIALPIDWLAPRSLARRLGRKMISGYFRFYLNQLAATGTCTFDLSALDSLRAEGGLIVAPNHPGMLDAVMILSRLSEGVCFIKAPLARHPCLGAGARLAGYIPNDQFLGGVRRARAALQHGAQLLIFPEGTRTQPYPLGALRGFVPIIARQAGVPIQTLIIETDSAYLSKGWSLFRRPPMPMQFRIRLGRRFDPPTDVRAFLVELRAYFLHELAQAELRPPAAAAARPAVQPALQAAPLRAVRDPVREEPVADLNARTGTGG